MQRHGTITSICSFLPRHSKLSHQGRSAVTKESLDCYPGFTRTSVLDPSLHQLPQNRSLILLRDLHAMPKMSFKMSIVALLFFASSIVCRPHRAPNCVENANPFDDPCFSSVRDEIGSDSLEDQAGIVASNNSRTIRFADTVSTFIHCQVETKQDSSPMPTE